jgi:peptide/nickel transport system substrate-binding protein
MSLNDPRTAIAIDELFTRRITRRGALQGSAAVGLSALALGGLTIRESDAADAKTLVVASGADAVTLDPQLSFDGQSPLLWRAVYENLLKYEGDTLELVPHLAESFEVSPDGLTYTFKIREGVTFSDGEPLNAAAVKLSIDRQIAVEQGIAYALANVVSVETPDDMTVILTLSAPSDGALSAFAGLYAPYIISPKAITENEQDGDLGQAWLRDNMVGTGPYLLESYNQSQQAVFSRNPNYWGGWDGDHVDQIIISYVKEPATERLVLEQGEIDIALFLPDDAVEEVDGTEGIVVTDVPSFNLYYLVLPTREGPTADKKVRQALSYGFDYDTWVNDIMRGKAQQAQGPVPSNFVGFNPDTPKYSYDPDKARALLAEAGYPDGGFTIPYTYETGYFWKRPLGELFQANMADLGITVDIQELSPTAWADLLSNPETANHAFGLVWWPTLKTPYDFMFPLFATGAQGTAGYNWGYFSNPDLDALLEAGTVEPDEAKRMEIYGKAQDLLVDEAPALYVYEKHYRLPMRNTVQGFVFNGMYIETVNFYGISKTG